MNGLIALLAGLAVLGLIWSDRSHIRSNWRNPARWWSRTPGEYMRSRSPTQPLNLVLGTLLGVCGVVWGIITLLG